MSDANDGSTAPVTRLPEIDVVKQLVGAAWNSVEVPGGKLSNRSAATPGVWSVPSILIRGSVNLLVTADAADFQGTEHFHLRFQHSIDSWSQSHLRTARPAFSSIVDWPPDLAFPEEFLRRGPTTGELGIGAEIPGPANDASTMRLPVYWCYLSTGSEGLLLFADSMVPMNVGVCGSRVARSVQRTFSTRAVVDFGIA